MKSSLAIVALSALGIYALPQTVKRDDVTSTPIANDTTVLNYALTLENLGNALYTEALAKFDEQAFNSSGYPPAVRERFVIVNEEEKASVAMLNQILGGNATLPCNYSFPYTDVSSFVNFSQIIESIGASAYVGLVGNMTNATNSNATEPRHAGGNMFALHNNSTWDGAPITPLTPRQVLTLIAPYITSCPSTNTTLPFTAFPALTVSPGLPGSVVTFNFSSTTPSNGTSPSGNPDPSEPSITILSSLIPTSVPASSSTSTGISSDTRISPTEIIPSNTGTGTLSDPTSLPTAPSSDAASPVPTAFSIRDVTSSDGTGPLNGTSSSNGTTLFAVFWSGLGTKFVPMTDGNNVTIPGDIVGQVYAAVTTSDTAATDDTIVAGPTVLVFGSNAQGNGTGMNQ